MATGNRKSVRVLALIAAGLLLFAATAFGGGQQEPASGEEDQLFVGYSAAGLIDQLQITWSEGVEDAVEDAGGRVATVDSQNDIGKQVSDIEDLLARGIDYLVVNPVDEAGIVPAIEAANEAGVPVVTIDRGAAGGDVRVHVGFDNHKAGYDAGVYIAEQNNETGKVAQLEGQAGTSVARERAEGFQDAIREYPDMEIVFEQPTDWGAEVALSTTEDLLTAHADVVGIWTHADSIAMGAVEALLSAGKMDQVVVVGMGMFGGGPESIAEGNLDASWELFPAELGRIAGQTVLDLEVGESVPEMISTDMVFVTEENIDEYM